MTSDESVGPFRTPEQEAAEIMEARCRSFRKTEGDTESHPRSSNERVLLEETRQLLRQMKDDIFNHGSLSGRSQRSGEELIHRIDDALAAPETASPQAPIARIHVYGDQITGAKFYAPGLPDGEHDLFCEPEASKDHGIAQRASEKAPASRSIQRREAAQRGEPFPLFNHVITCNAGSTTPIWGAGCSCPRPDPSLDLGEPAENGPAGQA